MPSARKAILVGEAPSRVSNPAAPFSGRSGARIAELLGRPLGEVFDYRNLLSSYPGSAGKGSAFDHAAGRRAAAGIFYEAARGGQDLVLVGRRVGKAFGIRSAGYLVWTSPCLGVRVVIFPHPSGVNRWWNDPSNAARARRFLRSLQ